MIKIKFVKDIGDIDQEFHRAVGEMFRVAHPIVTLCQRPWRPQIDVCETADEVIVSAELAGVLREDLFLEVSRQTFSIRGRRRPEPVACNTRFHIAEIACGAFDRSFSLPAPVDTETITALYKDGLLTVRMKKAPLDTVHKIRIQNE